MNFMILQKKGEVEIYQVVMTILAILGLVIALFFWYSFKDVVDPTDDTCKLSVLTRATAPNNLQGFVPLKCTTKKICITGKSANECTQFIGEESVGVVKLSEGSDLQKAKKIEETIAQAMYSCWNLMGEGKLNLFNGRGDAKGFVTDIFAVNKAKPSCVICSRVAIGKDLTTDGENILAQVDIRRYIENNFISGRNITYLEYFTDRQFRAYPAEFKAKFSQEPLQASGVEPTNQIALIFMQILTEKEPLEEAAKKGLTTGVVVGGNLFSGATGKFTSLIGITNVYKGAATVLAAGTSFGITFFQQKANQATSSIYCGQYTNGEVDDNGKPIDRFGCSTLQTIDYREIKTINNICTTIEGNP